MTTGYARIGLTGDYGIAWLLTRLAGTARARELMFLSEKIDARRCESLGLVNRVVPDTELREIAFALAKSLAEGPSMALARMKDNLDHALTSDILTSMDQEAENMVQAARTSDHKEAVRAFLRQAKTDLRQVLARFPRVTGVNPMTEKPIAVVTGVGPGTGSAIVRRFARGGFRVIALARSPDRIQALERELPTVHAMVCDVSDETQVVDTIALVRKSMALRMFSYTMR